MPKLVKDPETLAMLDPGQGRKPVTDPALLQQLEASNKPYETWGDYGKDLARVAGQGLTLGFGDELTAMVRSGLSTNTTYDQALEQERGAVERFREQNPGTALTTELASGMLLPGFGAAKTIAKGAGMLSKVARSTGVGATFGGAGGFGASEGGVANRLTGSGEGAVAGGAVGAAIPAAARLVAPVFRGAEKAATRITDNEESARLYFADRLRAQRLDEQRIADDLARGQQVRQFSGGSADLPETIADASPATQRILRGIKVGGDAEEIIEPFLANRQAGTIDLARGAESGGQFGRLNEQMRLALRVSDQELPDALETLSGKRKIDADKMFAAARSGGQPFDLSRVLAANRLRAMSEPDPNTRTKLMAATDMFTQSGKYGNYGNPQFPVNDIERFHKAKVALDNLIGEARGNDKRVLTRLKHDLMGEVTGNGRNPLYQQALDKYASQSELLDAAELGRAFYRGTEQLTAKQWRALSEAEKTMVRRAWLHQYELSSGNKAQGPTADFTGKVRSPNLQDQLRLIMPQSAGTKAAGGFNNRERMAELIRREQRMSSTAGKVLGNSSTAEKAIDAIDVGTMVRSLRYIKDQGGLVNAAVNAVADHLEKMAAIKGERARYLAEQLLSTDPQQQTRFLNQVAMTYGRRRATKLKQIADVLGEAWAGSAASLVGRQQETQP